MFHFSPFFFPVLRPLTKTYQEVVRSVFTSSTSSSGASRRQTMKDLQEEFSNLYNNIRLFEKGIKHFTGTIDIYFKKWIWFFKDVEFITESAFKVKEDQQFKTEELPNTDLMLECIGLHTMKYILFISCPWSVISSVKIIVGSSPSFQSVCVSSHILLSGEKERKTKQNKPQQVEWEMEGKKKKRGGEILVSLLLSVTCVTNERIKLYLILRNPWKPLLGLKLQVAAPWG